MPKSESTCGTKLGSRVDVVKFTSLAGSNGKGVVTNSISAAAISIALKQRESRTSFKSSINVSDSQKIKKIANLSE